MSPERVQTRVDDRELTLSNLDKVLYPEVGFTKSQVLDYYARIAEVMLPHLRRRPTTLKRYPNGVEGTSFYEKHAPANTPEWAHTITVTAKADEHEPIEYLAVDDRPTLLWAANLAALEFHVPLWHTSKRAAAPTSPDFMVFDLDPGPGTSIVECCQVAAWITRRVEQEHVYAKTSGSKGLQLYLSVKRTTWDHHRAVAQEVARAVERDHGNLVTSTMTKSLRTGKILIDWSQNSPSKTTVAAYSLRARNEPTVSTPVTWQEVARCAKKRDPELLRFDADDVLRRVERLGDLMAPLDVVEGRSSEA